MTSGAGHCCRAAGAPPGGICNPRCDGMYCEGHLDEDRKAGLLDEGREDANGTGQVRGLRWAYEARRQAGTGSEEVRAVSAQESCGEP